MTNWQIEKSGLGGGQSTGFIVTNSDKFGRDKFFLKELSDQNDTERRRRFYIETLIYKSIKVEGIPEIIETNADSFENKDITLYYVSKFIDGTRLDNYVQDALSEAKIIDLFSQLLIILSKCHSLDVVHRDIKPENIIISDNKLFLVDFGISFFGESQDDNLTKMGQELGNRFLRLPEHSAGSQNKRDTRSDLALAIGIGLYLITGNYPRTLFLDGKYPHQFEERSHKIKALKYSKLWNLIFDKGFMLNISDRWNSANDLLKVMGAMDEDNESSKSSEELIKFHAAKFNHEALLELNKSMTSTEIAIRIILTRILDNKASGFNYRVFPNIYVKGESQLECNVRINPIDKPRTLVVTIESKLIGDQVVGSIQIAGKGYELIRVSLGASLKEAELELVEKEVEGMLFPALAKMLEV